jgi:predicted  nucleic acid-binding Zn-ribbon protein
MAKKQNRTSKPAKVSGKGHSKPSKKPAAKKVNHKGANASNKNNNNVAIVKARKSTGKLKPKAAATIPVKKIEKIIDFTEIDSLMTKLPKGNGSQNSIEDKLKALYILQQVDSNIDKIRTVRGELPMEVTDLEDEIAGLQTRITNLETELVNADETALKHKQAIKDSQTLIKKYEGQQNKVKNNREYEALIKEIEYQTLEIQLSEKRIKENKYDTQNKKTVLDSSREVLEQKKQELETKKAELNSIIEETKKEEAVLEKTSAEAAKLIEDRLYQAYKKVRDNARNGLAVVAIQRDSCGGCFNKIPPQRQLDIRQHKKVIVCEHCGRILVDSKIIEN